MLCLEILMWLWPAGGWGSSHQEAQPSRPTEVGRLVLFSFSYDLLVFLCPHGLSSSSWASHMVAGLSEVSTPKRKKRKLPVLLKSTSKMYATYTHGVLCVSVSHCPASVWGDHTGSTDHINTRRFVPWGLLWRPATAVLEVSVVTKP